MSGAVERERSFWNARGRAYETARNLIGRSIGGFSSYGELETTYDPAGKRILDYGCGRGDDALRLLAARRRPRHRLRHLRRRDRARPAGGARARA